jgi:alpha/beta superfamily hydrolase
MMRKKGDNMKEIFINGPAGKIEGRYFASRLPDAPLAVILHPNPQLDGNMNNKVVYAIYQAFAKLGFSVVRFNLRGVGKSQGTDDGDPNNAVNDALAVVDWLKSIHPASTECWVGGYSFGAWVAAQAMMRRPDINGFAFVSPPADECDFSFLAPCPASGLIVQGGADVLVSEPSVAVLAERLDAYRRVCVDYLLLPNADHLYTKQLKDLFDGIVKKIPEVRSKRDRLLVRKKRKAVPVSE